MMAFLFSQEKIIIIRDQLVENFDRFRKLKHSSPSLKVFTEKGLCMLATILKSTRAVETTLAMIDTFAKVRELSVVFILLCITYTTVYAQDIQPKKEKDARILQLTKDEKLTDLTESPDGKWIVFVKKSNYTIPSNCFYFSEKGEQADEIWIVNTKETTKKLLVAPHFSCGDVAKVIIDPHNLQFSPNSKTLYFETSAWVTSGAIHAVDVDGNHLRFVTDGSELRVVQSGPYKGNIIVNQHRYRFKGDTPLGSYNWDWLFTPTGKQIKLYKKED